MKTHLYSVEAKALKACPAFAILSFLLFYLSNIGGIVGQTITTSPVTGTIIACEGTASVSPRLQQFTVSGSSLTGNITLTASVGFEISTTPTSGYNKSLSLISDNGTLPSTIIYVRSSATALPEAITGWVDIEDEKLSIFEFVRVSATVHAVPFMMGGFWPDGTIGEAYSASIPAPPAGYSYSATNLPAGLSMSPTGTISGTPTVSSMGGHWIVTVATIPAGLATQVTYNGSTTKPGDAGTYTVRVTVLDVNYIATTSHHSFTINKAPQTITFFKIEDKHVGSRPFRISAESTSFLPISYSVVSGPATISNDNMLTVTGVGEVRVKAFQQGNRNYLEASAEQTFTVSAVLGIDPALEANMKIYPSPARKRLHIIYLLL